MSRNADCPCGSGNRYKHCCGKPAAAAPSLRLAALAAHKAGSLGKAEGLYRQALAHNAGDVDVRHMLGVVLMQRLRYSESLEVLWESAERSNWSSPQILHNLGLLLAKLLAGEANRRQRELLEEFVAWDRRPAPFGGANAMPLVSVVMPTYNHAAYVAQAIASVEAQSYRALELVVIDDGSSDDTCAEVERSLADCTIPARFIARENRGAHATLNQGAALALGEFLAFLNSDDFYAPKRIERMVGEIAQAGHRWGFSQVAHVGADGLPLAGGNHLLERIYRDRYRALTGRHSNSMALVEYNLSISTGNLFVARELFGRLEGFRDYRYNHDWDFCLRASALAEPKIVREPLYNYRVHASNTISESQQAAKREADKVLGEFLADTLRAPAPDSNPLAPQAPANRCLMLRTALGIGQGSVVPAPELRALACRFRAGKDGSAAPAAGSQAGRQRVAVIVLGMHRSGTSAMARVLNLCGAYLPANLRPPKHGNNPKGFWEAERIIELNERVLAQLGGAWNKVDFALPEGGDLVDDFLADARELLASEYAGQPTILIKDPRIGVLAPLWQRALSQAGYRAVYVVPLRHPLEVAQSLHARGDMSVPEGLRLWADYSQRIESFTASHAEVLHVDFGELFGNWRGVVRRIADRLDLPLDANRAAAEVERFLEPELRHQAADDSALAAFDGEPGIALVRELFARQRARAASGAPGVAAAPDADTPAASAAFVLCIEDNVIREQALLLCESIRRFGGRHRDAPILAFAPRPGLGVDRETRARLAELDVAYVDEPLNTACPQYGSANRVFAAQWAEAHGDSDFVVVLDSDTLFLGEPALPEHADAAVRPVDSKGSASSGPGDSFESYWAALAELAGAPLDCLPWLHTTIGKQRIRASYNGGLVVVRRSAGLLHHWAELFRESVSAGLRPYSDPSLNILASTGYVGNSAAAFWGSNQTALALALWGRGARVHHYPASYNLPLHKLAELDEIPAEWRESPPLHVHFHWMFTPEHHPAGMAALARLGVPQAQLDWIARRTPLSGG